MCSRRSPWRRTSSRNGPQGARDKKEPGMRSATLLASLFSFAWAAVALAADRPSESQTVSVAGSLPAAKGAAEYFTGNVRVDPLFAAKDTAPFSGAYVTFEIGRASCRERGEVS